MFLCVPFLLVYYDSRLTSWQAERLCFHPYTRLRAQLPADPGSEAPVLTAGPSALVWCSPFAD